MSGRVLLVCVAAIGATTLSACDKLFDIRALPDPGTGDGGPNDGREDSRPADVGAPGDAITPCFLGSIQVLGVNDGFDPQMRADRNEIFYAKGNSGTYNLYHATRPDTVSPFSEASLDALNSGGEETDPSLTADGLMLIFKSNRGGNGQRAFQATRATLADDFTVVMPAPGLDTVPVAGLDISPDGKTIYIDEGSRLLVAHRQSKTATFGQAIEVSNVHIDYPSVTPNGLEVFSNGMGIIRSTRQTISDTEKFQGADSIESNGADPDVLPDNSAFVYVGGSAFYTRDRCN